MPSAVTRSQFTSFLPNVKITVDSVNYTIPVWDLSLTLVPWSGIGSPNQELADGRVRQKIRGWHIKVVFDATFSHETTGQCAGGEAIDAAYNFGSLIIDLDPVDNVGDRVLTLVMVDGKRFSEAQFDGHVRNRRFTVTMITEDLIATGSIPAWFAGDPTP